MKADEIGAGSFWLTQLLLRHCRLPIDRQALLQELLLKLASYHAAGNVCLPLDRFSEGGDQHLLGRLLEESDLLDNGSQTRPLVLDEQQRLYYLRPWLQERALEARLRELAGREMPVNEAAFFHSKQRWLSEGISLEQSRAVVSALRQRLCIITGGPGTGKTTTILRLLAVLLDQPDAPRRIALAAPTGKAAARMQEALHHGIRSLNLPSELQERLPQESLTLHRLLGIRFDSDRPLYHAENPLGNDLVIVDEASMIDLSMMHALLNALPSNSRLVLLGDPGQLASIDAGDILRDISAHFVSQSGETALVAHLSHSYRFSGEGAIAQLAQAISRGDTSACLSLLSKPPDGSVCWIPEEESLQVELSALLPEVLAASHETVPENALARLASCRVLCAHNTGARGVSRVNQLCERTLGYQTGQREYHGRPILVTRNDSFRALYNGDSGLLLKDSSGKSCVYFPSAPPRAVELHQLPPHETSWALTVHKSQGSEFDHAIVVLGDDDSPLHCRQLLYTAVTRARKRVTLLASANAVKACVSRLQHRDSGLFQTGTVPHQCMV